jgi:hypothetical protein
MNVTLTVVVPEKEVKLMLMWRNVVLLSCRVDGVVEAQGLQKQKDLPAYMPWYMPVEFVRYEWNQVSLGYIMLFFIGSRYISGLVWWHAMKQLRIFYALNN